VNKRFLCSKNGFKKEEEMNDPSKKERAKWTPDVTVMHIYT
jgi:hypothetical protein